MKCKPSPPIPRVSAARFSLYLERCTFSLACDALWNGHISPLPAQHVGSSHTDTHTHTRYVQMSPSAWAGRAGLACTSLTQDPFRSRATFCAYTIADALSVTS